MTIVCVFVAWRGVQKFLGLPALSRFVFGTHPFRSIDFLSLSFLIFSFFFLLLSSCPGGRTLPSAIDLTEDTPDGHEALKVTPAKTNHGSCGPCYYSCRGSFPGVKTSELKEGMKEHPKVEEKLLGSYHRMTQDSFPIQSMKLLNHRVTVI